MQFKVKMYDLYCEEEELPRNILKGGRKFLTFIVRRNNLVFLYCQEEGITRLEMSRGRSDMT